MLFLCSVYCIDLWELWIVITSATELWSVPRQLLALSKASACPGLATRFSIIRIFSRRMMYLAHVRVSRFSYALLVASQKEQNGHSAPRQNAKRTGGES